MLPVCVKKTCNYNNKNGRSGDFCECEDIVIVSLMKCGGHKSADGIFTTYSTKSSYNLLLVTTTHSHISNKPLSIFCASKHFMKYSAFLNTAHCSTYEFMGIQQKLQIIQKYCNHM